MIYSIPGAYIPEYLNKFIKDQKSVKDEYIIYIFILCILFVGDPLLLLLKAKATEAKATEAKANIGAPNTDTVSRK